MPDALVITDLGGGAITLDNDPAPAEIQIGRVMWEQMVNGALPWAVVTQDQNTSLQHLVITADNVTAEFTWVDTGPGRSTILSTDSWA